MDEFCHGALLSIIAIYATVRSCVTVWKTKSIGKNCYNCQYCQNRGLPEPLLAVLAIPAILAILLRWRLGFGQHDRSEEHTSELQSPMYLVCRLLLEKKKYTR